MSQPFFPDLNNNNNNFLPKEDNQNPIAKKENIFDEIFKELETSKKFSKSKSKEKMIDINNENINPNENDIEYKRMKELKEGLQIQPHFDFGIPLNENASLSIIQMYKEKKENNDNFKNILSKINILKWLKAYTILMDKEIQNVNLCLNQLKKNFSFDFGKSTILCEVKNLYIIDCYQLLDVMDANYVSKKIILTRNVKKNPKDKGKIKIIHEYFVNIGDLILFKKPITKSNVVFGEEYIELDVKSIQKIVPFHAP